MSTLFTDISPSMKGVNFEAFGGFEGFLASTSNGGSGAIAQQLCRVVPWLAKAKDMTALAVGELPFDVLDKNGEVVDTSSDWKNKFGGMDSPADLFYKLAASLCFGKAYAIKRATNRMVVDLQYCAPQYITENIQAVGLIDFNRITQQGGSGRYVPAGSDKDNGEAMAYFWLPDSDVELGPALSYPAGSALLSAEMLVSMDSTINTIAGRGFISPTVLMAKGMGNKDERILAETWWNRFIRGWTSGIAKILNGDAMTALKIGSSMDELRGIYPELSKQAIENIGTAFGIPAALFMADMAFASEVNPLIKVWYSTSQFVKIYRCIETTFNNQIFNKFGVKLKFKPETLDAFQANEGERAENYAKYKNAGVLPSIAAQMVGLQLPEGVEFIDLDPAPEPEPIADPVEVAPVQPPDVEEEQPAEVIDADMVKSLNLWRQVSTRRYRKGQGCAADFESAAIPDVIANAIRVKLADVHSEGDILKAFEIGAVKTNTVLTAIERANQLLEKLNKE